MNDLELKQALMETWPTRPGQEARAWNSLQGRLQGEVSPFSLLGWGPRIMAGGLAIACLGMAALYFSSPVITPFSADSQSPGIFATAFYSQPARAQVVWLNGMDPATDGPTYMDPTTKVDSDVVAPAKANRL